MRSFPPSGTPPSLMNPLIRLVMEQNTRQSTGEFWVPDAETQDGLKDTESDRVVCLQGTLFAIGAWHGFSRWELKDVSVAERAEGG